MVWNRLGPLQQIQNLTAHDYLASSKLNAMSARPSATSLSPAVDTQEALPVFEIAPFIALDGQTPAAQLMQQCQQLADCLARTGCLLVSYWRSPLMLRRKYCRSSPADAIGFVSYRAVDTCHVAYVLARQRFAGRQRRTCAALVKASAVHQHSDACILLSSADT